MRGAPLVGQTLGQFQIVDYVACGGMGTVYRGRQPSLGRFVAIKVLADRLAEDGNYVERFHREARTAAAISHPNIIEVHDIGKDRGHLYIAMELVDGESLADVLKREGRLLWGRAVIIMRQVADALACAHEHGILHRDIKPANILIQKHDRVKVADFGLAKRAEVDVSVTVTGQALGTPLYLPPEWARGKELDARTDLYSVGATFYHVVAGRPPFDGASATEVIVKHIEEQAPALQQRAPDAPPLLCHIIHRLLSKAPADRYQTANELLDALRDVGRSMAARPALDATPAARGPGAGNAPIVGARDAHTTPHHTPATTIVAPPDRDSTPSRARREQSGSRATLHALLAEARKATNGPARDCGQAAATPGDGPAPGKRLLGDLAVELCLISREHRDLCLGLQREAECNPNVDNKRLGEVLVERGLLASEQLEHLLQVQRGKCALPAFAGERIVFRKSDTSSVALPKITLAGEGRRTRPSNPAAGKRMKVAIGAVAAVVLVLLAAWWLWPRPGAQRVLVEYLTSCGEKVAQPKHHLATRDLGLAIRWFRVDQALPTERLDYSTELSRVAGRDKTLDWERFAGAAPMSAAKRRTLSLILPALPRGLAPHNVGSLVITVQPIECWLSCKPRGERQFKKERWRFLLVKAESDRWCLEWRVGGWQGGPSPASAASASQKSADTVSPS
ncbi:serine/threonine protein kinase [bacterium]|nr:serine/threonine protein kinase [bacterium]